MRLSIKHSDLESESMHKVIKDLALLILKIFNDRLKQSEQEAIIKKLAINGANFNEQHDRKIVEICNKVQKEVKPQIYSKIKKLREVAENSIIEGTVTDIEFDNKTFFIEFSKNSKVDVAKIAEGARSQFRAKW